MASFEEVTNTFFKNVPLNKCVAPNNHVGKKILQNLIKVLLLIRACWKEFFSKINKRVALLFGTLEYIDRVHCIQIPCKWEEKLLKLIPCVFRLSWVY